ncbi:MAG: hypothetical protein K2N03_02400 [Muribaculaceae bacterium]|nr:hypothetical protein [Muribaculaceae bacterium]
MKAQKRVLTGIYAGLILLLLLLSLHRCDGGCSRSDRGVEEYEDVDNVNEDSVDSTVENEVEVPDTLPGESGNLRVALLWDHPGDMDLHVVQPNGRCVDFARMRDRQTGGRKDIDNVFGGRGSAENIYWEKPGNGEYEIFLNYYPHPERSSSDSEGTCLVIVEWKDDRGHEQEKKFKVQMTHAGQWSAITKMKYTDGKVIFEKGSRRCPEKEECDGRRKADQPI